MLVTPWLGPHRAGARLLSEATSDGKIKAVLRARGQPTSQKGREGQVASQRQRARADTEPGAQSQGSDTECRLEEQGKPPG